MNKMTFYTQLWRLYWRASRLNKLFVVLMTQAVVVIAFVLYVLANHPDVAMGTLEDQPQLTEEINKHKSKLEHQRKVVNDRYQMTRGATIELGERRTCTLFRFDKLHVPDNGDITKTEMINDQGEFAFFSDEGRYKPSEIPAWFNTNTDYCEGCLVSYGIGKYVVSLRDVTIYPQFGHGKAGGEDIEEVLMQTEEQEEINLDKGYFVVKSKVHFEAEMPASPTLKKFLDGLIVLKKTDTDTLNVYKRQDMVAVVVARRDYANYYHATMDLYDVFLIMVLFKIDLYHLEVIWLDAHPKTNLDKTWEALYGLPVRAGSLTEPVNYNRMIWSGFGYKSHINQHQVPVLPYAEEFRHFVLSRFEIDNDHVINCDQLRITIIWRRHHVAHPRNPSGYTSRRIANEDELWRAVKEVDYTAVVNGVQLEKLNMAEQLELISRTDILIGMHGAGMTHILYLPGTSGVIELFPEYTSVANAHFRAMSKWRQLRHVVWSNQEHSLEHKDHQTTIPPDVIQQLVRVMIQNVCESE